MKVAVVLLNYNGAELLPRFLPSVVNHSKEAEIWVIDNGSTDSSLTWLSTNHPEVRQIRLEKNYGFCTGYNDGLKQIQADVYVLLNSDVEVTSGWLNGPLSLLKEDVNIAAVQPKILSYRHRDLFEYAGAGGGFLDELCYPYCRGRIFDQLEKDSGQYNDCCEVMWGSGACLFVRSSVYEEQGGLEPTFFAHMEEIDLCWRIRRSGKKIFYCGTSTVYHLGGGTLPVSSPRKTYLNFRNNLSLMVRNLRLSALLWILPSRFVLDHIAAVKFFLEGNGASSLSVLKAWINFLTHFYTELQKRKATSRWPFMSGWRIGEVRFLLTKRYL